ncbi:MAG: PAC2 family protein [Candidatus Diapherotrites archaeon]|nr:PAC2 family protein [Candidatus Diapherotrites archaeon]
MVTDIKFLKRPKIKNAVLFSGLPGIGLVGKIAADYIIRQFKTEKIAEIYSDSFPPAVHTNNGIIEPIKDDIVHFKANRKSFLFVVGPVQPSLDLRGVSPEHYEFAEEIVSALHRRFKLSQIITLAGINIGERRMNKQPNVIVAATNKKLLNEFAKLGCVINRHGGLISGAAGLLISFGRLHKIEGACLMGETNANLIYGDHGAAKRVVEVVAKKFNLKIKMDAIEKEAKRIEESFAKLRRQIEMEETSDEKQHISYVR